MKRVASLDVRNSFFGNSNSRGMVISAVSTVLMNNTFANLPAAAVDFFEGGCGVVGAQADYTEGPFSKNILIENNTFIDCAVVETNPGAANNGAVIEIAGCRPVGECGSSGFSPFIPVQPSRPMPPGAASNTSDTAAHAGGRGGGGTANGTYYSVSVVIPAGAAAMHTLKYAVANGAEHGAALVGLYNSSVDGNHPTALLGSARPAAATDPPAPAASFAWLSGSLSPPVQVDAGKYFLVLWMPATSLWTSVATPGNFSRMTAGSTGGSSGERMPDSLGRFWGNWTHTADRRGGALSLPNGRLLATGAAQAAPCPRPSFATKAILPVAG